jgi:hypothetical protein
MAPETRPGNSYNPKRCDNPACSNGKTCTGDCEPGQIPKNGFLDRRTGIDRRDIAAYKEKHGMAEPTSASSEESSTGLERRRGPGRRRTDFTKSAEEGELTTEQFHFLSAVEAFKRSNNKMFPTWTDVLEVVRLLGYRKTMPSELNLRNVEDWKEKSDAPSGVRCKPGHPEERRRAA